MRMRNIMRGYFALLNRYMHDLMRTSAIAGRVDMRSARLHLRIRKDAVLLA
jgi:hypothetical protein